MNKKSKIAIIALLISTSAIAQSESFQTLEDHFKGNEDVHSFNVSGFFCRMVLGMAGEWQFKDAIEDVKHIRLMVIPHRDFKAQDLSLTGFKKFVRQEGFEELAIIRDHGDVISFYLRTSGNKKNTYFVLVEEHDEVVAIELKGYIDPAILTDQNTLSEL